MEAPGSASGKSSDVYIEKYLFDLESDPAQHQNLISEPRYAAVRADLSATLSRLMVRAGEKESEIRSTGAG